MKKLALLIVALFCVSALADDLPKIAVYVTGNVGEDEKKALGTRMLASLINSGRYKGIERSNSFLAEIEKEQEKQRSGAIDDGQISELGRQFGVKFVCIADITPVYGAFQVSARIVNVETAEVDFIGESSSPLKTVDDLTQVSDKVVRKMFGEPEPEAQPPQKQEAPDEAPWWKPKVRISAGAGGFFAGDFGGGIEWDNGEALAMPHSGGGAYIFIDAVYAEIFAGYAASGGQWRSGDANDTNSLLLPDARRTGINSGLFVKYPFAVSVAKVFPLVGVEYEYASAVNFRRTDGGGYVFGAESERPAANLLSALWIKFGAGADVDMGKRLYARAELLYGFRGANDYEEERVEAEETKTGESVKTISGNGLTFKAGVGVKF